VPYHAIAGVDPQLLSLDIGGSYNLSESAPASEMFQNAFATAEENQREDTWIKASPTAIVEDAPHTEQIAQFFLVTNGGARDPGRPLTEQFEAALSGRGIGAQTLVVSLSHAEINQAIGDPADTLITPSLTRFLRASCK
jgi:hypothetical protein